MPSPNPNPNTGPMIAARRNGKPTLKAEYALRKALKDGGLTECGAYRLMVEAWNECIAKALDGNMEALKLLVERLDGKAKQTIDQNVNVSVAFEQLLSAGRARAIGKDEPQALEYKQSEQLTHTIEHVTIDSEQ